jgi:hypothetical protein
VIPEAEPDPDPGFLMTRNKKFTSLQKRKTAIVYLSCSRSLKPPKENIGTALKNMNFLHIFWIIFAFLGIQIRIFNTDPIFSPDSDFQSGSLY